MTGFVWMPDAEQNIRGAIDGMLERIGDDIAEDARDLAPSETGTLRRSIHRGPVEHGRVSVSATAPYAAWVELGTKPHDIEPVHKQALFWPEARHPVRRVRHPGTIAQPYLRPALERERTY